MSEPNPKHTQLEAIEGLTLSDCLFFFDSKATERDKQVAALVETRDERFEVDNALISEGDGNGAYVLGWRWVTFAGTDLDKGSDEDEDGDGDKVVCPGCSAVEGSPEWGTVGDGFDGYCPSCADKREADGAVEIG
jgi:hypothetical protein